MRSSNKEELDSPVPLTLVEMAEQSLREAILTGELASGRPIRLQATAQELGMSMSPVREALRSLASEGLTVPLSRRGYQVADLSDKDLADTYQLRMVLDPMAIREAMPHLTSAHLARAADSLHELVSSYESGDEQQHRFAHRRFHFALYEACQLPWLLRILTMLWQNSERYQSLSITRRGSPLDRANEHRKILDACQERDTEGAARLQKAHLEHTYETVRELIDPKAGKQFLSVGYRRAEQSHRGL